MPKEKWTAFKSLDAFGTREIGAGDLVRPWIGAGPFFEDLSHEVTGRSFFEDLESTTGEDVFRRCLAEGEACMAGAPVEGDRLKYLASEHPYEVIPNEDPLVAWGRYNRGNHLVSMYLSTRIVPRRAGVARFRMHVRVDNQVAVAVNGTVQYRSYENAFVRTAASSWAAEQDLDFELMLEEGENILTVGAFRMGRIASGALFLETLDMPLQVSAPLCALPNNMDRQALEASLNLFHPAREWFYPDDTIRLVRSGNPPIEGLLECGILVRDEVVKSETVPMSAEEIVLGTGGDIGSRSFEIRTFAIVDGERLGERRFGATCVTPTQPMPGKHRFEERLRIALEHYAAGRDMWAQLARYTLGRPEQVEYEVIDAACEQMDQRLDCADFGAHPLLRLMYMDRDRGALSGKITERITGAFLNFRYWTDEPGSDCLVMGTENHQILFHSAEYLAGAFWPDAVFSNSGMTGRAHMEKGRNLALKWLRDRGRSGFREWHSSSYYPHWMVAVLSMYECAPQAETEIRNLSQNLLTAGCFNLAEDSFEGILGTTHGRVYAPMLKIPDTDGCAGLNWLLYGEGHLGGHSVGVVPMATGGYRPPEFFADIASDSANPVLSRHHQGNDANFIVYRTPDYMMSVLQDYRPGEKAAQVHPFQVTFQDRVAIFFSCPQTSREGGGHRPDYWSGNAYLPRAFGERNAAVLLFRPGQAGWMSHGYFERDRFDEVVEKEGWLVVRKNQAFVGIWSEHGYEIGASGPYAGRELICRAEENAWIVQAGRQADWGNFEAFVKAICATEPHRESGQIVYASPDAGTIRMGWEGPILLNDKTAETRYPLLDSPYGYSDYGSGKMRLQYGDEQAELTF